MFSDDLYVPRKTCPRCKERYFERFKTHGYCANCNYSEADSSEIISIPHWALEALKAEKLAKKREPSPPCALSVGPTL